MVVVTPWLVEATELGGDAGALAAYTAIANTPTRRAPAHFVFITPPLPVAGYAESAMRRATDREDDEPG
jgi:hypothetical protein